MRSRSLLKTLPFLLMTILPAASSFALADCPVDACATCGKIQQRLLDEKADTDFQKKYDALKALHVDSCHISLIDETPGFRRVAGCSDDKAKCRQQDDYTWTFGCGPSSRSSTDCQDRAKEALTKAQCTGTPDCHATGGKNDPYVCTVTSSCMKAIDTGKIEPALFAHACPEGTLKYAGPTNNVKNNHSVDFYLCNWNPPGADKGEESPDSTSPVPAERTAPPVSDKAGSAH
jgi:hypothetical protein